MICLFLWSFMTFWLTHLWKQLHLKFGQAAVTPFCHKMALSDQERLDSLCSEVTGSSWVISLLWTIALSSELFLWPGFSSNNNTVGLNYNFTPQSWQTLWEPTRPSFHRTWKTHPSLFWPRHASMAACELSII